jgi:transposase
MLDEVGRVRLEQRVRTNAKALQEVFGGMPCSRIALEIGTHSPWISRLLSELGHEVIVANARKVRLIGESRKKDDRLDAQTLARLARIDPELLYPATRRGEQRFSSSKKRIDLTRPAFSWKTITLIVSWVNGGSQVNE